nr:hypothetical protein [Tanacetum cinerariifolium]
MADATGENKGMLWFLDSGCSNHMCGNKDRFVDLDLGFTYSVKLGNNSRMMVVGKGNVKLFLNGATYVIKDVYHVPDLKNNLLSIGQLQQKGLSFLFQSDVCKIGVCTLAMKTMLGYGMNEWDISATQAWRLFKEKICRKGCVYLLTENSQALESFRQFKRKVETETGKTIKALHTDRGGEYLSNDFKNFCLEHGIKRQLTTSFSSQQNGVAERKNRTVINMVVSMISAKSMPKKFWGEATMWSFYVLNRCPTKALANKTPEEAWSGVKPTVHHLRMSEESKAYRLIDPQTLRVIVSKDVIFEEHKTWSWSQNNNEGQVENEITWGDYDFLDDDYEFVNGHSLDQDNGADEQNSNSGNSSPETPDSGPSSPVVGEGRPQRVRRRPTHLNDYFVVVRGYVQEFGVDYEEVYASVARMDRIRLMIALAAQKGCNIYQMDVKSAFLHGTLEEDVNVQQPQGYMVKNNEHKVYKLQKPCMDLNKLIGLGLVVLRLILLKKALQGAGNDEGMLDEFKCSMKDEFEMTDMGKMRYFLGIEVFQSPAGIHVSRQKYAVEILTRFNMLDCNAVVNPIVPRCKLKLEEGEHMDETLYKSLVGSLMYITTTRPNIQFVVSYISRFVSKPTEVHFAVAKRVLRYLQGTLDYGIWYKRGDGRMEVFTDSDFAGDQNDRKSTSGYLVLWDEAVVSWSSKKQNRVALSSTEAEYVAAATCACQVIWIRGILEELGMKQEDGGSVFCGSFGLSYEEVCFLACERLSSLNRKVVR